MRVVVMVQLAGVVVLLVVWGGAGAGRGGARGGEGGNAGRKCGQAPPPDRVPKVRGGQCFHTGTVPWTVQIQVGGTTYTILRVLASSNNT